MGAKSKKKANLLHELDIHEVSFVNMAANNRTFLLMKNFEGENTPEPENGLEGILKTVSDPVQRAALNQLLKQNQEMADTIKKQKEQERERVFLQKAASYPELGTQTDIAAILKTADDHDPKLTESLERLFKSLQAQLETSALFKELGNSYTGSAGMSADGQIQKAAAQLMRKEPTMTPEQAAAKAMTNDPSLYKEWLQEQRGY